MRKFTLYQAARYSKISRYKLEQAISEGLIKIQTGKGNIKCFIDESELQSFIDEHGDQYRKYEYKDEEKQIINMEDFQVISKEIHQQMLDEKERIIQFLQRQQEQFLPLLQQGHLHRP